MANKIYDLVEVKTIEGKEKPIYTNHGILLVKDDGKMSIKLNSVPVGGWDGWLSVFEKKKQEKKDSADYAEF